METKDWTQVSSQVDTTKYDRATKKLLIQFKTGQWYEYSEVPVEVWERMKVTASIGKFVGSDIKGKYLYRKVNSII